MSLGGLIGADRAAAAMAAPAIPENMRSLAQAAVDASEHAELDVDAWSERLGRDISAEPRTPPTTDSIIETAAARLAFVEGEIDKLRGYEDERELLERMLAAAAPQSAERKAS
jgi:hypothetical protein